MKGVLSILGLFLPHFFAATLSRRKATDKRPFKYFLPYGYMKRRMKYVFRANVGDEKKDCGIVGLFRWVCPYGTILWWDGGRDATSCASPVPNCQSPGAPELGAVRQQIESLRREVMDGSERLELLMLRFMTLGRMNHQRECDDRNVAVSEWRCPAVPLSRLAKPDRADASRLEGESDAFQSCLEKLDESRELVMRQTMPRRREG